MSNKLSPSIKQRVADQRWFHAIDFGEFASSGRFKPGEPQNITLFGAFEFLLSMDLLGSKLLDIGTYDGIVSFGSHALGASVDAVDAHDNPGFRLAREILDISLNDIRYTPNVQIGALHEKFQPKTFDVIVCAGVIYHMLFPMQAFTETRKLLADDGLLIMETPYDHRSQEPILTFNGISPLVNEPRTYFIPTISALVGMANFSGYKVIATRTLKSPKRVTLLLRAVARSALLDDDQVADFTKQMLKRDSCDDEFRFRELEKIPAKPSSVALITNLAIEREIDATTEKTRFPYHYHGDKEALGSTRFETPEGNLKKL